MVWWLARTEPRRERLAKYHVEQNPEAEAYLPMFWDPFAEKIYPLFPNYLFVRCPNGVWGFLRRTIGIFSLVMRGPEPDTMSDKQLDDLKEREYQGLVQLQKFAPGQKVDIAGSVFQGWNGIYQGMSSKNRCTILLDLLGQTVSVSVDLKQVRPV